ncbi:MAG: glycosyltransferase family 4 protein [Pedobacter sp.]
MKIAILSVSAKRMHVSREELIDLIKSKGHDLVFIGPRHETECVNNFASLGVRYLGVKLDRIGMNPFSELKLILELKDNFKRESPDLIITYGIKMAFYGSMAATLAGVKKIFPIINGRGALFQMRGAKSSVVKTIIFPLMKIVFKRCNIIFFQNYDDFALFSRLKLINDCKCKVVNGSGVNLEKFSEVDMPSHPVFLLVSRLIWAKGIKEYIDAAIIVKRKFSEARFLLLGPFDEAISAMKEKDLEKYIKQGTIEYKGVSQNVHKYYNLCTCYVLPSFYGEGVPRTILEAMATGRPIITTDTPGCKETVNNYINGFLVPPKDAEILAEKMCWMIENPEKAKIMGHESRKYCEKKFDVNVVNKIMTDLMGI